MRPPAFRRLRTWPANERGTASPPRRRDDITDRSDYEIRLIEWNVMAAALGHDLLADARHGTNAACSLLCSSSPVRPAGLESSGSPRDSTISGLSPST